MGVIPNSPGFFTTCQIPLNTSQCPRLQSPFSLLVTAFSILLFTETWMPGGFFLKNLFKYS
jgi:hypothetical protein